MTRRWLFPSTTLSRDAVPAVSHKTVPAIQLVIMNVQLSSHLKKKKKGSTVNIVTVEMAAVITFTSIFVKICFTGKTLVEEIHLLGSGHRVHYHARKRALNTLRRNVRPSTLGASLLL